MCLFCDDLFQWRRLSLEKLQIIVLILLMRLERNQYIDKSAKKPTDDVTWYKVKSAFTFYLSNQSIGYLASQSSVARQSQMRF